MIAYIEEIARFEGQAVTLRGWLHNRRSSGKIHFLQVRDGSGFIQCVMSKQAVGEEMFTRADHLSQESSLIVHGSVRADARAPGGYEIEMGGVPERHLDDPPLPLQPLHRPARHRLSIGKKNV